MAAGCYKFLYLLLPRRVSGPCRDNPDVIVQDLYEPCAPRAPGAIEMTWLEIDGNKLKEPLVTMVSSAA